MKLITIDLEISARAKRIALAVGIPALLLGASAIAFANVPNAFKAGDALSAQKMNDNFADIDARLAGVSARYSSGGQTIMKNSGARIDFSTKDFDATSSVITGAAWKFTAQGSGKYHIDALVTLSGASVAGQNIQLILLKNGKEQSTVNGCQ